MYVILEQSTSKLCFTSCSFSSSDSTTQAQKGGYARISCPDGFTAAAQSGWSSQLTCAALRELNELLYVAEKQLSTQSRPLSAAMLYFVYALSDDSSVTDVVVSSDRDDVSTCGWPAFPCLTIYKAKRTHSTAGTIKMMDGTHTAESELITFGTQTITLEPFTPVSQGYDSVIINIGSIDSGCLYSHRYDEDSLL